MISILAIGKKHESWVESGIKRYSERLRSPWNLEWALLPHSSREGTSAREDESSRILTRLKADDYVVLLDERGRLLDSPALAQKLEDQIGTSQRIVIIIGGAYGVNEELTRRANLVWSLAPLVFPHQLVRLILTEQLYRSQEIATGKPYPHSVLNQDTNTRQ